MRHICTFWLVVAVATSVVAAAQRSKIKTKAAKTGATAVVEAYADSLSALRLRIDSMPPSGAASLSDRGVGSYYRLFVPATFYHSSITGRFAIDDADEQADPVAVAVDSALMNLYMTRPDLVANTETRLRRAGSIRNDVDKVVMPEVDMTDKIELLPDDEPEPMPSAVLIRKPNFWAFSGDGYLQFLQNFVSGNWYKGGESNYSMVGNVTLNANYNNKSKLKLDNKLELKLGFQTSRGDTLHKFKTNNDMIRYTGKVGLQASKRWYYTLQLLAYTQFTKGLKSNDDYVYSDFMSPFNLNVGLGMDYSVEAAKKRLKGNINIAPLSFNFRYVDRKYLASRYGIKGDHRTLEDFGSQLTADLTWTFCDQVKWKTRLYFYTTYERTEIEWENTITLAVSKYISANLFLYPRFDDSTNRDDKLGYLQFKEYSSLGFSYSF